MTNSCQHCSKKIPISKVFCSPACKENYFQKIAISVPKPFVKKLYFFCTEEEKSYEIKTFAKRHNWHNRKSRRIIPRVLQVWINSTLLSK